MELLMERRRTRGTVAVKERVRCKHFLRRKGMGVKQQHLHSHEDN
jgi:hypothetical protein